ncbi:SH3 domain-containing protein, partial [Sporolactobacillus sp. THM19-2]|uniref:SH3 domain-containing protein n=1 Tax=Sporolactobacillus sp. THM19-2 TaxID=2511171 RepID=UPI0010200DEA
LNVRTGPGTSNKRLTTLKKGTKVDVTGEAGGGWLKIKYNGGTAYVSGDFVARPSDGGSGENSPAPSPSDESDYPEQDTRYGVVTTGLNFRKGPSKSYDVIRVLQAGTRVEILTGANGWLKVSYGGRDGYVYADFIREEETVTKQEGDTVYITTKYPVSFGQALQKEQKVNGSSNLAYYLNPRNFSKGSTEYYQFLQLSSLANLNMRDMQIILAGRGILSGYAAEFITAAENNGVNEVYLVSHALLETGNGTSSLAKGVRIHGTKVYNMFGIGAYDGNAVNAGAEYAYSHGWTTPGKAIEGGAAWIADHYIYNRAYRQDTLYKMRWNPDALVMGNAAHQYATDPGWAVKQTPMIDNMYRKITKYTQIFDVPEYRN